MKIIKQGDLDKKPVRELTCSSCKCQFQYDRHDVKKQYATQHSQNPNPDYVECPNCENKIPVQK